MSGAATVKKNCRSCGDLIEVRLADHKRGWGTCCDKACAAAFKAGMRPRDVNAGHAKAQGGFGWAANKLADFAAKYGDERPPLAPSIKSQVGKVKVRPIYHSPAFCRRCGEPVNGPGLCDECDMHVQAMNDAESGWDGHKDSV